MKIIDIVNILDGEMVNAIIDIDVEITNACGADLMSDVMAFAKENAVLLTGLINPQVIRTAEMMDIKVVVFVRGKEINEAILNLAKEKEICIIRTRYPMFDACGKLFNKGLCR